MSESDLAIDAYKLAIVRAERLRAFTGLLRRFCQHELDQWENCRYRTSHGYVYITIARELPDGHRAQAYNEIPQADADG